MTKGEQYIKTLIEEHLRDVIRSYKRGRLLEEQVLIKIFKSFDYISNGKPNTKNGTNKRNISSDKRKS